MTTVNYRETVNMWGWSVREDFCYGCFFCIVISLYISNVVVLRISQLPPELRRFFLFFNQILTNCFLFPERIEHYWVQLVAGHRAARVAPFLGPTGFYGLTPIYNDAASSSVL